MRCFSLLRRNFSLREARCARLAQRGQNLFLTGFFNSLFICLPVCSSHFICIRSLLIHGPTVGLFSFLGLALGNLFFLISVIYGWRWIILPWFSLEPINYIFGLLLMIIISYNLLHEKKNNRPEGTMLRNNETIIQNLKQNLPFSLLRDSEDKPRFQFATTASPGGKDQLLKKESLNLFLNNITNINIKAIHIKYLCLLFSLVWTEQAILFPFLINLNLGISSTILNGFSNYQNSSFAGYLGGLVIGLCFFSILLGYLILQLSIFIPKLFNITYSSFIQKCNITLILLLLTFSFSSIPYYGIDYLVLGPLGFVSKDKSIASLIPNNDFKDYYRILGGYSTNTDISLFDSAKYLLEHQSEIKMEQSSFEELNYQADYMWSTRSDRIFRIYQRTQSEFLKKITNLFSKSDQSRQKQEEAPRSKSDQKKTSVSTMKTTSIFRNNLENRLLLPEYATILSRISKFSFNNMFFQNTSNNNFIQARFQQKYYSNPIFFNLLNFKIDTFINRLPKTQILNHLQQNDLFQKRIIISNYYDSINFYKFIPYYFEFQEVFSGSKSFAHRPYHHQFKGTLKNIHQRSTTPFILVDQHNQRDQNSSKKNFSMRSLNSETNPQRQFHSIFPEGKNAGGNSNVLSFDMPLYKTSSNPSGIFAEGKNHREASSPRSGGDKLTYFHEELFLNSQREQDKSFQVQEFKKHAFFHSKTSFPTSQRPWKFLNLNLVAPFYIGWNEKTRLFMISNQYSNPPQIPERGDRALSDSSYIN